MSSVVSAISVMVYSVCGYCSFGTSGNVFTLRHQILCPSDIGMCLTTCIPPYFSLQSHDVQYEHSDIAKCLRSSASCSSERNRYVLSCVYSYVFYPLDSVGSPAGESMSTVLRLGRMENDVNLYNLSQIHSVCVLSTAISLVISLFLRVCVIAYCRFGFRIKNIGTVVFRCGVVSAQ